MYTQKRSETRDAPVVFSDNRMMLELWSAYKRGNLEAGSYRTLDKTQANITTSEGESYTMLRSVWMDDEDTFMKSWQWTKDNLQREDSLMSWKFGQISGNEYGVLANEGGQNTASDADVDIALALLMAGARWKEYGYKADALAVIQGIWDNEVVDVNGTPILAADDLEKNDPNSIIVNPSYFSPYAYRIFAKFDPTHDWQGVVDSSYNVLTDSSASSLDTATSSGFIPDWIRISRDTGSISAATNQDTNYGYDAMRTPWRMALDWNWYHEPRAKKVLESLSVLEKDWSASKKLAAVYAHDGKVIDANVSPALYGGAQAYFDVIHPDQADNFYTRNLVAHYDPDTQSWKSTLSYYDDNWVWFGMALHNNLLPNLTELADE